MYKSSTFKFNFLIKLKKQNKNVLFFETFETDYGLQQEKVQGSYNKSRRWSCISRLLYSLTSFWANSRGHQSGCGPTLRWVVWPPLSETTHALRRRQRRVMSDTDFYWPQPWIPDWSKTHLRGRISRLPLVTTLLTFKGAVGGFF